MATTECLVEVESLLSNTQPLQVRYIETPIAFVRTLKLPYGLTKVRD